LLQVLPGTAQPYVFVHIAGTGTAEDAVITATTCTQHGGAAGTITFTAANSHSAGYTVQSSSQGFQEAIDDANYLPTNYTSSQLGVTTIPPGNYTFTARVSVVGFGQTVDMTGATIRCNMNDSCIFVGDYTHGTYTDDVTLFNPVGQPGITNSTHPFIEVNGQKTRIFNVASRGNFPATFGSLIQVDNDQAFLLDGLDAAIAQTIRNDATYSGAWVTAPGPYSTNAAVGWLKHMNLSPQCDGNGVYWASGNSLRISDSVIQGFAEYGVIGGPINGGFLGTELDNVYMEAGSCSNPLGAIGRMGVYEGSGTFKVRGGADLTNPFVGQLPVFANTGGTVYLYYAVIRDTTNNLVSDPFLFGYANTSGSGNITATWPCLAVGSDTITYDILRTTQVLNDPVPYGTGTYSVATSVAQGSGSVCTATDTNATPSSYTVAQKSFSPIFNVKGALAPNGNALNFWPGGLIMTNGGANAGAIAFLDDYNPTLTNGTDVVSTAFSTSGSNIADYPTVFAHKCEVNPISGSPLLVSCLANGGGEATSSGTLNATILGFGIGATGGSSVENNLKGRLIFEKGVGTDYAGPSHWITLADSNPFKTYSYGNNRPPNDADDVWIGFDPTGALALNAVPLAFGSPVSISEYIGNVGDGSSWLERLTTSAKTFTVAVAAPSLTDSGLTSKPLVGTNSGGTLVAGTTVHDLHFAYGTPGGSALSTGVLGYQTVPIGCTLTGWNIEVDAGTATVKTLKVASGTAIPTLGSNSISTSGVAIASGTVKQSTTLTDFTTTTITANDILAADLTAVSGVGYINFELITACSQ